MESVVPIPTAVSADCQLAPKPDPLSEAANPDPLCELVAPIPMAPPDGKTDAAIPTAPLMPV